jgi:hypothetical protein
MADIDYGPRVMPIYDGHRVQVRMMLDRYRQALWRLQEAVKHPESAPVFWALFETLNWAVALDDLIAEIWRPAGAREGFEWRSRMRGAEVLDGVRYVRNRVHHQWANSARLAVDDAPSVCRSGLTRGRGAMSTSFRRRRPGEPTSAGGPHTNGT